jgi:hypothetical protein
MPPVTSIDSPVTNPDSSIARKTTVSATPSDYHVACFACLPLRRGNRIAEPAAAPRTRSQPKPWEAVAILTFHPKPVIQKGRGVLGRVEKPLRRDFVTLVMWLGPYDEVYGAWIGAS